jgi:internalin A
MSDDAVQRSVTRSQLPRLLAILVVLLGLFGWLYLPYYLELRAFHRFRQLGGNVHVNTDDSWAATLNGRIHQRTMLLLEGAAVEDDDLAAIHWIVDLQALELGRTKVTDSGFLKLPPRDSVGYLGLQQTQITNAALRGVQAYKKLKALSLGRTGITDAGLQYLRNFDSLEQLILSDTTVTDAGLPVLATIPRLLVLQLDGTQVTDAGLTELRKCPKLEHLDLSCTGVTDAGLRLLAGSASLETLLLNKTAITDDGLKCLADLPELIGVQVSGTDVSKGAIDEMKLNRPQLTIRK